MTQIAVSLGFVDEDGRQLYRELSVAAGTSIYQLLMANDDLPPWLMDWCRTHPEDTPNHTAWFVGIYSQKKPLNTILQDGDRVEIYRPLNLDPMAKRKSKAKAKLKNARKAS